MSRDERNRRISELREPSPVWNKSATNLSDGGSWVAIGATLKYKPRDWQKDAAWPTLLREMRDDNPVLRFVEAPINAWVVYCWKRGEMVPAGIPMTNIWELYTLFP